MPRALPCPSCGQMFLPSGLRFHQKVCQPRQSAMIVSCPYCQMEMPQIALNGHTAVCKAARRAHDMNRSGGAAIGAGWRPGDDSSGARFIAESLSDGRSRCQFCGRVFTESRIHQHRAICGSLRQARPASIGGVRTQLPKRVYNAAAARVTLPGSFERQRKHLFIPREAAEHKGVLVRCAGVARKIGSKAAATLRPWTVLGVPRHASRAEVKAAYHRLAMEWHPDRHPDQRKAEAEARFKAIAEAHEAMTKPRRGARAGRRQLALVAPESWRAKHNEFLFAARSGRGGGARGAHPPRQPLQGRGSSDDRVLCPHCNRRFGQVQAERHIPKCVNIVNKPRPPLLRATEPLQLPQEMRSGTPEAAALRVGDTVVIDGLTNAPHLNRVQGVLKNFDPQAVRWHVELPSSQDLVAVKPENLRVHESPLAKNRLNSTCPPMGRSGAGRGRGVPAASTRQPAPERPRSCGPSSSSTAHRAVGMRGPHYGGHPLDAVDTASRQQPSVGNPLDVPDSFLPGAEVLLQGLMGASHLNGVKGVLRHFDHVAARWHVELAGGETKAVRSEHLSVPGIGKCDDTGDGFRVSSAARRSRQSSSLRQERSNGALPRMADTVGRGPGRGSRR